MGIRFNSGMDAWITNGIVVVYLVNHSLVECLFGSVVFAYEYSAPLLVFSHMRISLRGFADMGGI